MFKKLLSLPVRIASRLAATVMGRNSAPPADPPPPPRRAPRPKPPAPSGPAATAGDDDHGHDHGHSHDHGHDHGHAAPAAPPVVVAPPPVVTAPATPATPAPDEKPKKVPAKKKSAVSVRSEETPNPNAHKYVLGQKVVEKGSLSFNSAEAASGNVLGTAVFKVNGVASVFAVNDFVTVTKAPGADWTAVDKGVIAALSAALS